MQEVYLLGMCVLRLCKGMCFLLHFCCKKDRYACTAISAYCIRFAPSCVLPSFTAAMVVSHVQAARRALVTLLLALGEAYNIAVVVSRESPDAEVQKAYRRVAARVHPDKGGSADDSKKLNGMRDTWQRLRSRGAPDVAAPPPTRKRPASSSAAVTPLVVANRVTRCDCLFVISDV